MTLAMAFAVFNAFADDFTKSIDSTGSGYKRLGFVKVKSLTSGQYVAINTSHMLGYFKDGSSLSVCLTRYLETTDNCMYIDENIRDLDNALGLYSGNDDDNTYNTIETSGNKVNQLGLLYLNPVHGFNATKPMVAAKNIVYYSGDSSSTKVCLQDNTYDKCMSVNIDVEQFNQLFGFEGDYGSDTSKIKYSGNKINKTGLIRFNSSERSDSDLRLNSELITVYGAYNESDVFLYSTNTWVNESTYRGKHSNVPLKLVNDYFGFIAN